MRTFEFKKTYEEIKINGADYKIELSDEKIAEYKVLFDKFYKEAQSIQLAAKNNLTAEQEQEQLDKANKILKTVTNTILGQECYDALYEQSGRSMINMIELATFLSSTIEEKVGALKTKTVEKYTKKPYNKNNHNKQR